MYNTKMNDADLSSDSKDTIGISEQISNTGSANRTRNISDHDAEVKTDGTVEVIASEQGGTHLCADTSDSKDDIGKSEETPNSDNVIIDIPDSEAEAMQPARSTSSNVDLFSESSDSKDIDEKSGDPLSTDNGCNMILSISDTAMESVSTNADIITSEETSLLPVDACSGDVFHFSVIVRDENSITVEPNESLSESSNVIVSENLNAPEPEGSAASSNIDDHNAIIVSERLTMPERIEILKMVSEPESITKKRGRAKKKSKKIVTRRKKLDDNVKLPSVYSRNEIARHKKRIDKLKALEDFRNHSDGESDEYTCDLDRELDINLRIFEESLKSLTGNANNVIGEIQCNFTEKTHQAAIDEAENQPNVFKLSVNSFHENGDKRIDVEEEGSICTEDKNSVSDKLSYLSDDCLEFSDVDSDLEILTSKPIIRRRASTGVKKEKRQEAKNKITMYDLIHDIHHDSSVSCRKAGEEDSESDEQEEPKAKKMRKTRVPCKKPSAKPEPKIVKPIESAPSSKEIKNNLPVPKLKVGADGEVVIDMESLIIEQTGVSEARNALANSEVIEECALSYKSYNKKCSYKKQWTPHETLKFYKVLSTIGTDFTLMATLFPGRTRKCMKRKFKREEKSNAELIKKALSCKQDFNIEMLEKELRIKEEQVNQIKENNDKKRKNEQKAKKETKSVKKIERLPRKSFFERGVSRFQDK